jgi:hypothetical protein
MQVLMKESFRTWILTNFISSFVNLFLSQLNIFIWTLKFMIKGIFTFCKNL